MNKNSSLNKINDNIQLFLLALLLFCSQQIVEIAIIQSIDQTHSQLCRWDCLWYHKIVEQGYDRLSYLNLEMTSLAFFPLFPLITKAVSNIFNISTLISLLICSKIFFLLSIFAFMKFAKEYFPKISPFIAGITIAYNPYAIYANSGYTEPLFLLLTCLCFYYLKQKRLKSLAVVGSFLTATRLVGAAIGVSYGFFMLKEFWKGSNKKRKFIILNGLMIGSGLISFMIFLYFHTGNALAFIEASKAWGREINNPVSTLLHAMTAPYAILNLFAINTLFALYCCCFLAKKGFHHLAIFSLICIIIPISTSTLYSMPRYIWYQAPILLAVCYFINKRPVLLIPILAFLMLFHYVAWFSKAVFII